MEIDRTVCRELATDIQDALEPLAKELGVVISVGSATFTPRNVIYKLEVATLDGNGHARDRRADEFKRGCYRYGLRPDDLGAEFLWRSEMYSLIGVSTRARKFPLLAKRLSDGREFKFPADVTKLIVEQEGD